MHVDHIIESYMVVKKHIIKLIKPLQDVYT